MLSLERIYPADMKRFLLRMKRAVDRTELQRLVNLLYRAAQQRNPRHLSWRVMRAVWLSLRLVAIHGQRLPPPSPLSSVYEVTEGPLDAVLDFLAKVGIIWMREKIRSAGMFMRTGSVRQVLFRFRSAVRCNCFPAIRACQSVQINHSGIWTRMRNLAAMDPQNWMFDHRGAMTVVKAPKQLRDVSVADVNALLDLPDIGPRDRCMIVLLCTTGLRVEAVSMLRKRDVWDAGRNKPRRRVRVMEKGSRIRSVDMERKVCQAVTALVISNRSLDFLLAPDARPHRPATTRTLRVRLKLLCQRAGIAHINPHAFRHFVVNNAIDQGASLTDVAAYLGHEGASTAFKHYWTSGVDHQVNACLGKSTEEVREELINELESLERELREVQTRIESLPDSDVPPVPPISGGVQADGIPLPARDPSREADWDQFFRSI